MKPSTEFKTLIWTNICIAVFLAWTLRDLISLLIPSPGNYDITLKEKEPVVYSVDPLTNTYLPDRPLLIPKIIHQTYKTTDIPQKWAKEQQSCINLHGDYTYILWTDESARDFIKENYNWFLPTFDSYPYNIMRADVIRYFVLYHYGGVYIDLDNGCNRRLDALLTLPAWFRDTEPTGISNDIMASIPKHDFMLKIIDNLQRYNHNWIISYITIMYSTGPLFVSCLWKQYLRSDITPGHEIRILLPESTQQHKSIFFYQVPGSSWHNGDAAVILLMDRHKFLATICCCLLALLIFYMEYKIIQIILRVILGIKPRTRTSRHVTNPVLFIKHLYSLLWSSKTKSYTSLDLSKSRDSSSRSTDDDDSENEEILSHCYDEKTTLNSSPTLSTFVSAINLIPAISNASRWLSKTGYNTRKRPESLLLPTYHCNSSNTASTSPSSESDVFSVSSSDARIPLNSNIASSYTNTPCIYIDEIDNNLSYEKHERKPDLLFPNKQTVNISTVSLSSTGNEDSQSMYSLSPMHTGTNCPNPNNAENLEHDGNNERNTITGMVPDKELLVSCNGSNLRPNMSGSLGSSGTNSGNKSPMPSPRIGPLVSPLNGSRNE